MLIEDLLKLVENYDLTDLAQFRIISDGGFLYDCEFVTSGVSDGTGTVDFILKKKGNLKGN